MAYVPANLSAKSTTIAGSPTIWAYKSTDVHTDVVASGYFSDGFDRGMKVDDIVHVVKTSATKGVTTHSVASVTTGGAATLNSAILA